MLGTNSADVALQASMDMRCSPMAQDDALESIVVMATISTDLRSWALPELGDDGTESMAMMVLAMHATHSGTSADPSSPARTAAARRSHH